jgi:uncharacterized protein with NAD-binding domain and iron-sulfur cluster
VKRGGEVRLRSGVREVRVEANEFAGAVLEDGSELKADACVVAIPHEGALGMLPKEFAESGGCLEGLQHLKTSPITSVHFWFESTVMSEPFLALLDHTTQWIFNKTLLSTSGATGGASTRLINEREGGDSSAGQYLQLVISASYDSVPRSRQEIIDLCRREMADVLPATREAKLRKATVIKEVNATFSPAPGVDRWRPSQSTGIQNLFLAGDWTQTGWPATMEGAVRSGYLAGESLLAKWQRPGKFLQGDLPLQGFSKMWANRNGPTVAKVLGHCES